MVFYIQETINDKSRFHYLCPQVTSVLIIEVTTKKFDVRAMFVYRFPTTPLALL